MTQGGGATTKMKAHGTHAQGTTILERRFDPLHSRDGPGHLRESRRRLISKLATRERGNSSLHVFMII